jgi:hypothetical protein
MACNKIRGTIIRCPLKAYKMGTETDIVVCPKSGAEMHFVE